jgi:hypothetical protein
MRLSLSTVSFSLAMKLRSLLALAAVFASALAAVGATTPAPSAPETPPRELTLVVVEPVESNRSSGTTPFDYLDIAFHDVAKARQWPVKLVAERLAGNQPDYPLELRLFVRPITDETPNELALRVWVTLVDHGTKHDFGIIKFTHYPRPGAHADETLEKIYRGFAERVADKIEPLLFPKS